MKLETITPDLIQEALAAWQRGDMAPQKLLELRLIQHYGRTSAARSEGLYRLVRSTVADNLYMQRQSIKGLPKSEVTLGWEFSAAEKVHNRVWLAWSALYHRWIVETPISVESLAAEVGYSSRSFRRYVRRGMGLLAHALSELERTMYEGSAPRSQLPSPEYSHLFGHHALVQAIIDRLLSPNTTLGVNLEGIGGIGKTALAREVAYQLSRTREVSGVFWVSAREKRLEADGHSEMVVSQEQTLDDIFAAMACQLGQPDLASFQQQLCASAWNSSCKVVLM